MIRSKQKAKVKEFSNRIVLRHLKKSILITFYFRLYSQIIILMSQALISHIKHLIGQHVDPNFPEILKSIQLCTQTFFQQISQDDLEQNNEMYKKQFQIFVHKFNSSRKTPILLDQFHRNLIVAFMRLNGIQHYKYSYYNRAKITNLHIRLIESVGPILFSEAVMIASKVNIINKNNSRFFIEDHLYTESQSPVDMKIQQILKLSDEKKRSVNNNFKKLQLILDCPEYLEVIKQLGKMLRDSWKKDKSKIKCPDFVKTPSNFQQRQINSSKAGQDAEIDEDSKTVNYENIREDSDKFSFTSSQKAVLEQINGEHAKIYSSQSICQLKSNMDENESYSLPRSDFSFYLSLDRNLY